MLYVTSKKGNDMASTNNGTSVARPGMAITRKFKNAAGEYQEEVTFADVEGRLKIDTWIDCETGQTRSKLGIVAESFQSLSTGDEGQPPESDSESLEGE